MLASIPETLANGIIRATAAAAAVVPATVLNNKTQL
jgi:hypothetical protein